MPDLATCACACAAAGVGQELACTENHSSAVSEVETLLRKQSIDIKDKLRLVILYALRYEREPSNRIAKFTELLGAAGASAEDTGLVARMLQHAGAAQRTGDLFGNRTMGTKMMNWAQRSVKGVQNVYTQHSPYLSQQLEQLAKGTLSEKDYPYLGVEPSATQKKRAPTEVIVVLIGGATYEEARAIGEMNASNPGVRITLLGTTIHRSESYLDEISKLAGGGGARAPPSSAGGTSEAAGGASQWASNLASLAPPNVDRKRIAALTSSVTSTVSSTVQAGVQQAMGKLQ